MRALLAAVAAALVVGVAPPAAAYVFMETCEEEGPAAWDSDATLTWHLSSTYASDDLTDVIVRSSVGAAFAAWNAPDCANIPAQGGDDLDLDPFGGDSAIVLGFYEDEWPPELGVNLLALTQIAVTDDCRILDGDIVFNGADHTWINGAPTFDEVDFRAVATHEVGHLLGVDHTEIGGSTMFVPYDYDLAWRDLGCDDTGAICELYPTFDTTCDDSSLCPCDHPCVGGLCEGYETALGALECWERFAPEESGFEEEPNDESTEATTFVGDGGDLVITGSSASCGNDGAEPTADVDWLVFDVPCNGRAWVSLEASALDADVDLFVFNDGVSVGSSQVREQGPNGREGLEVTLGKRFQTFIYCWEGAATDWTLTVHYLSPGEQAGFPDSGPACAGCSTVTPPAGGAALLLLLLGFVRRRS